MRLIRVALAFLCLAGICAGVWGALGVYHLDRAPVVQRTATVEIPRGAGPARALQILESAGVIEPDARWTLWVRLRRAGRCLQAGTHRVEVGMTSAQLFGTLCSPTIGAGTRVTVPEGYNIFQIADLLAEAEFGTRDEILALAMDPAFSASHEIPSTTLEGYLYPETYEFAPGTSAQDALARMIHQGDRVREALFADHELPSQATSLGLDHHQLVILASLVEREAQVADERARIAQVFYNRLIEGMRLQTDPTCVYSAAHYRERPTRAHCRDASNIYSTYVIDGLPPTPIANPGVDALRAVLAPSGEHDLFYFVAMRDGTGRHAFATTLDEHNANVQRYLRAPQTSER